MKRGGTSGNGKERLHDYSVSRSEIPQRSYIVKRLRKSSQGAKRTLTGESLFLLEYRQRNHLNEEQGESKRAGQVRTSASVPCPARRFREGSCDTLWRLNP